MISLVMCSWSRPLISMDQSCSSSLRHIFMLIACIRIVRPQPQKPVRFFQHVVEHSSDNIHWYQTMIFAFAAPSRAA